jgi:hypothetical protein
MITKTTIPTGNLIILIKTQSNGTFWITFTKEGINNGHFNFDATVSGEKRILNSLILFLVTHQQKIS